jgi:hypothetical protein
MKTLHTLLLAAVVALAGCATASKMNQLSIGMTKKEVIAVMGSPSSSASPGNGVEFLRYELLATAADALATPQYRNVQEYYVRLINGKVDSYGRVGDYDSAKDPTINLNIKNR